MCNAVQNDIMTGKYRFSIIVPVYNVKDYLERCMDSLLHQDNMDGKAEILLIDDGSDDGSGSLCDRYAERFSQVRTWHKKNGGLSSARNLGIEKAGGDYILFVDSDDYMERSACRILDQALEQHGEVDALVYGGVEDDGVHQTHLRRLPAEKKQYADGRAYLLEHYRNQNMNVEAWLYGYRREFLLSNRLSFREGILHEDVEFTPRALLACRKVLELPDCLYHYMVRENSICTQKDRTKNIRDLFQTLRELEVLAEQQEEELCRWMKNALLNSFLNMVQDARMYQPQYRMLLDKRFLRGKAATAWNRFRVLLCMLNVKWYCLVNDCYKRMAAGLEVRKRRKG